METVSVLSALAAQVAKAQALLGDRDGHITWVAVADRHSRHYCRTFRVVTSIQLNGEEMATLKIEGDLDKGKGKDILVVPDASHLGFTVKYFQPLEVI